MAPEPPMAAIEMLDLGVFVRLGDGAVEGCVDDGGGGAAVDESVRLGIGITSCRYSRMFTGPGGCARARGGAYNSITGMFSTRPSCTTASPMSAHTRL